MSDQVPDAGKLLVELLAVAIDVKTPDETRKRIAKTLKDISIAASK